MNLGGHLRTVVPSVIHRLRPLRPPTSTAWSTVVDDPAIGPVRLTGRLSIPAGARTCVIVLHGIGGDNEAYYALAAAAACERAGLGCLRLNLRGAGAGADALDFYNAALTSDLGAAIASAELRPFDVILVLGYSLGGHLALRYATEEVDPRVRAVAAVCPPLDLERSVVEIDRPGRWLYRRYLLAGLQDDYAAIASRRRMPLSASEARRIVSMREWDRRIIAPRFGFPSAERYYADASVGPRLARLAVPSLLVAMEDDPMVPAHTIRPSLEAAAPTLDVRWIAEGGHVGFAPGLDLGMAAPRGLEPQIVRWLADRA